MMLRLLNAYTILVNQSDHLSHVHDSAALNIEKTVLEQSNTAQHHHEKKTAGDFTFPRRDLQNSCVIIENPRP